MSNFKKQVEEYWKRIKLLEKENNNKFFNYDDMEIKELKGYLIGSKKAFEGEIEFLDTFQFFKLDKDGDFYCSECKKTSNDLVLKMKELKKLIKYADENLCEIMGKRE